MSVPVKGSRRRLTIEPELPHLSSFWSDRCSTVRSLLLGLEEKIQPLVLAEAYDAASRGISISPRPPLVGSISRDGRMFLAMYVHDTYFILLFE